MDSNAFTTPFQLTKTMKREIYPAIDPNNPELSATGKTVLITGATGGIVLVGRKKELLDEPASAVKAISPSTQVLALIADLTSDSDVEGLFKHAIDSLVAIDVLDYELNVKASYTVAHYYLKSSPGGSIIFLGTLGAPFTFPGLSSYSGSKLALMKLAEFLDAEKPKFRVFTVHPGIVGVTETNCGAVVDALTPFAKDKGIQTGGLSLYLAQKRAGYLRGGFISVNWDDEEMEAHQEEIKEQKLLKLGFLGAKLGSDGHPWSS
ncbi:oxidoreductase [Ascochyta rabiei]|uniref:Oxidoreductase n=1 Tax=Didymella rabiei TaxID=5454 RepID=A0A163GYF8_DIDRA|nr:oxidoreductase [Ascochyta rabiei]